VASSQIEDLKKLCWGSVSQIKDLDSRRLQGTKKANTGTYLTDEGIACQFPVRAGNLPKIQSQTVMSVV